MDDSEIGGTIDSSFVVETGEDLLGSRRSDVRDRVILVILVILVYQLFVYHSRKHSRVPRFRFQRDGRLSCRRNFAKLLIPDATDILNDAERSESRSPTFYYVFNMTSLATTYVA